MRSPCLIEEQRDDYRKERIPKQLHRSLAILTRLTTMLNCMPGKHNSLQKSLKHWEYQPVCFVRMFVRTNPSGINQPSGPILSRTLRKGGDQRMPRSNQDIRHTYRTTSMMTSISRCRVLSETSSDPSTSDLPGVRIDVPSRTVCRTTGSCGPTPDFSSAMLDCSALVRSLTHWQTHPGSRRSSALCRGR